VHDPRITLELIEPPGEVIVPEPPYWFGKKARRSPFLLPREAKARLTIPADVPEGLVKWQVANANGASATGRFMVSHQKELSEPQAAEKPLSAADFPVNISGQIKKIREVDCFEFVADRTGLITCTIEARILDSPLNAVLEIRDESNRIVFDVADTGGNDASLTFLATQGHRYRACLYDVDFRGNRSFVYRLGFRAGLRVLATIPAAAQPGTKRSFELLGYGLQTGRAELESVVRDLEVSVNSPAMTSIPVDLPEVGTVAIPIRISDLPEVTEAESGLKLSAPVAVTGVLDERYGEDVYLLRGAQGEMFQIDLEAKRIGSPLDVTLTITDAEGKELVRSDDLPNTTDAGIEWTAPADGEYRLVVSDVSGHSGQQLALYRLAIRTSRPGFELSVPELIGVPLGGKATLSLKAQRTGGFKSAISVSASHLPEGVSVPEMLVIPEGQSELKIEISVSEQAAAVAGLVTFRGEASLGGSDSSSQTQSIVADSPPVLLAATLKPPFEIDAEGKDDVTKWPRGSTFPAPVLIERNDGFQGEIVLEMTSRQGRHRQGIRGPELAVPPDTSRILYPVYLPEWLETTRTSRMVVNGVAQVADPKGNVRYLLSKQKTRMGFLPIGALLKVSTSTPEIEAKAGESMAVPFEISRSIRLTEPVRLELIDDAKVIAEGVSFPEIQSGEAKFDAKVAEGIAPGEYPITLRATVLQDGQFPVVSEIQYLVVVQP
ncbi:MAG TPA: hypothetical protein VLA12_08350, partial [Planctomycetaceae bacterium]|nr:hypothetical protein [Planctomycetaceae bacterium]